MTKGKKLGLAGAVLLGVAGATCLFGCNSTDKKTNPCIENILKNHKTSIAGVEQEYNDNARKYGEEFATDIKAYNAETLRMYQEIEDQIKREIDDLKRYQDEMNGILKDFESERKAVENYSNPQSENKNTPTPQTQAPEKSGNSLKRYAPKQ